MLPADCAERFAHVRPLGAGGFGEVHLAIQLGLGREVVIKVLREFTDLELIQRFEREAQLPAQLGHPGIQ